MRIQSSAVRSAWLCGLCLGGCLIGTRPASAEVTVLERDGYTFFTDGRVNVFFSQGVGDAFPAPSPNTNPGGMALQHSVVGAGQPFTAGYETLQGDANGKYNAQRMRSGFLASILAFGVRRQVTEWTRVTSYIALWETAQSFARDRSLDLGQSTSKGFDVREGFFNIEGPWGGVVVGRQRGLFGRTSTDIDYLYGHNYGLGLPCPDDYYATCGHIGTGAIGPGFAAGFVYTTPSIGGVTLQAGLYDPVRLLGVWERVPYPRPEGILAYDRVVSPSLKFRLSVEGMYQYMAQLGVDPNGTTNGFPNSDKVWGVAGGGRLEAGPLRLGLSAFRGKGLGVYVALQNSSTSFNPTTRELRSFTGVYAQTALVFGPSQISAGVGRVTDDLLDTDKADPTSSQLKSQTGASLAYYHTLSQNLVVGIDYFFFRSDWWGAPNSTLDATGNVVLLPGVVSPEKQVIHFVNVGVTFHW